MAEAEFAYKDSPNKSASLSLFYVVYGMHPRGVFEIFDLAGMEKRSANGEEFSQAIHDIQEKVKHNIEDNNQHYKKYVDQKWRHLQF